MPALLLSLAKTQIEVEYQRWYPGSGWQWSRSEPSSDPDFDALLNAKPFSLTGYTLAHSWKVQVSGGSTDAEGWSYAFNWCHPFYSEVYANAYVRKRTWVRQAVATFETALPDQLSGAGDVMTRALNILVYASDRRPFASIVTRLNDCIKATPVEEILACAIRSVASKKLVCLHRLLDEEGFDWAGLCKSQAGIEILDHLESRMVGERDPSWLKLASAFAKRRDWEVKKALPRYNDELRTAPALKLTVESLIELLRKQIDTYVNYTIPKTSSEADRNLHLQQKRDMRERMDRDISIGVKEFVALILGRGSPWLQDASRLEALSTALREAPAVVGFVFDRV